MKTSKLAYGLTLLAVALLGCQSATQTKTTAFRTMDDTTVVQQAVGLSDLAAFLSLQNEVTAAIANGGGTITISNDMVWPMPLNMRQGSNLILQAAPGVYITANFDATYQRAPVIDMTGTERSEVNHIKIRIASGSTPPACGILLAREVPNDSANLNRISNCEITGNFGDGATYGGACVYNVGCEIFHITDRCNFRFSGQRGYAYFISAYNEFHVASPYGAVAGGYTPGSGGAISSAGGTIDGSCHFACDGVGVKDKRGIIYFGDRVHSVWAHDIYITAKTQNGLKAVFTFGSGVESYGVSTVDIRNVHDEAYAAQYLLYLRSPVHDVNVSGILSKQGKVLGADSIWYADGLKYDVDERPYALFWNGEPEPLPASN